MNLDAEHLALECECGHPARRHVMGRARCAIDGCGCVVFEVKQARNLLRTALSLDERLEIAERELELRTELLRTLLADEEPDGHAALMAALSMREELRRIIGDPLSKREAVQSALIRLLEMPYVRKLS